MDEEVNQKEIQEALDSIREIKKTLKSNMLILRPYLYEKTFVLISFLFGLVIVLFTIALYFLAGKWGGFTDVPLAFKAGLFAFLAAATIILGFYKYQFFFRSLKKENPTMNLPLFFSLPELRFLTFDALFLFAATMAISLTAAYDSGSFRLVLPFIYLFVGYEYFQFAALFYLNSYRVIGTYCFILSVLSILIKSVDSVLWTGGTLASFFFFFSLTIFISARRA